MKGLIVQPTLPYSHAQLMRDITGLKAAYPQLMRVEEAGFSVEGRELPLVILGTGKRKLFCCGTHHAREYITSAYLMYAVNVYAQAAQTKKAYHGFDMAKLLSSCTMYVMPMVNPDGVVLVQGGLKAVQDKQKVEAMIRVRPSYSEWKANINGVDLNRQYPALWEKKYVVVREPASELFNGTSPASEPEVRAVMRVCRNHDFSAALSFHTKGEVIYWADKNTYAKIDTVRAFAEGLSAVSGYTMMPISDSEGIYAAGFENWFRQEFLRPGILVELTPSTGGAMPHHDKQFFPLVWDKTKKLCAQALKVVSEMKE